MKKACILLVAVLLLELFCGCDLQNRRPSSEFIPETTAPAPTEAANPEPTEPPTEETTEAREVVVHEVFSQNGTYTDGNGKNYTYSYHLPYLDAETDYAMACNVEIESHFRAVADAQAALMEEHRPLEVLSIDYETRLRGDVLTVYVTQKGTEKANDASAVYTVDRSTGEQVPGLTLVKLGGFADEESFRAAAEEAIRDAFAKEYAEFEGDVSYDTALELTLREENYGVDMPMYLDRNDRLVIFATLYDPARAPHSVPLTLRPDTTHF